MLVLQACVSGSPTQERGKCRENPLIDAVRRGESMRVIARLVGAFRSEAELNPAAILLQRQAIASQQDRVLQSLQGMSYQLIRRFVELPLLVLVVDEAALCRLLTTDLVVTVERDAAAASGP